MGVWVLLCFASAWTSAMHLPFASLRKTALWTQPPLKAEGCRNTEVAAAFVKPYDRCVGVGVSELSALIFGDLNDSNALRLCAPSCRGPIHGRFLGDAAKTDAAAVQMTLKGQIASTTRVGFSSFVSTQSRARSMIMLTPSQVPQRTSIPQTHFP